MHDADERAGRDWLVLVGVVIGAMLVALLIQWLLVKPYRIPSASMMPTLDVGERVLVDRVSGHLGGPQVGQIWVFHPPRGADAIVPATMCARPRAAHHACLAARPGRARDAFIKRVVGVPGDRLELRDGRVVRNGRVTSEPFATRCHQEICDLAAFTVPADHYFMMGDNRGASSDSRFWGPVARSALIGRAVVTYWPVRRIGGL